jgi:hypothetical protein
MKYAVKVYCEGYVVVGVEANSIDEALEFVEDSSFYFGNDACLSEDTISIETSIDWCKEEGEYTKECAIQFDKEYGYLFNK